MSTRTCTRPGCKGIVRDEECNQCGKKWREAPRMCSRPSCKGIVRSLVCSECGTQWKERNTNRGSAAERGYDRKWQRYRARYLARHPLCEVCKATGRSAAATVVHHIVEVNGQADALFWEPTNHQALCRGCHERRHGRMR